MDKPSNRYNRNKTPEQNKFNTGAANGKHYWLTPKDLMAAMKKEFKINFDACPFPQGDFDGLTDPWGTRTYCNPPFGSIIHQGKKKGPTAWVRKAIQQQQLGKTVVLVFPLPKWIMMLMAAGAEMRNLGDVKWLAIEDKTPGPGTGHHIAQFILKPKKHGRQRKHR